MLRLPIGVDAAVGENVRGEVGELDEAVDRRPHGVSLARAGHPGEREGAQFDSLRTEKTRVRLTPKNKSDLKLRQEIYL